MKCEEQALLLWDCRMMFSQLHFFQVPSKTVNPIYSDYLDIDKTKYPNYGMSNFFFQTSIAWK